MAQTSKQELPPAWHSAETAFQCLFRAVGALQVTHALRPTMRSRCAVLPT